MRPEAAYPGAPRWVKLFGILAIGLISLFVVLKLTGIGGDHGPGRHLRFLDPDGPDTGLWRRS